MNAQSFPLGTQEEVPATHWDGDLAADIFAPCGTPWLAVFDGISVPADYTLGGYTVMLTADDGMQAYYAHGLPERVSGRVRAGDIIGYVSDSGNADRAGCHLHFAVGQINSNGGGTINPKAWLEGITIPGDTIPAIGAGVGVGVVLGLFLLWIILK